MKRTFVLAPLFESALNCRRYKDEILVLIESAILQDPRCGDLTQGTGGVRKLRVEDVSRGKGKRGGFRVLYLDLPHVERTHLLFLYDKGEADNLSPAGKKTIKALVEIIKGDES